MKTKAFIKLPRELFSQPQVADLLAKEGAAGLGLYVSVNLYLAHCEGGWGVYTGRQLSSLAIQLKKHRSDVVRVICNYGLFVIEGSRFTSLWMQQQFPKDAEKMLHSRPYISMRAEDIELDKDIEKEKQKKCVCQNDTHSQFEILRAGRRYASHGQPLPGDAQTLKEAIRFLASHFFIVDAHQCKGIDDILETARQIGLRYQVDMTVIDPANWVDMTQAKGNDPMERVNYVINQVVDFAQVENQLTWMVAHPRKPPLMREGKTYVPEMWDIAGTSDYANKATWVEIMERDTINHRTKIHIKKVRFGHLGTIGECCVRMDPENHRFVGFDEIKSDAGNVIQYKLLESDKSNWLISKAVQQGIKWE